MIALAELARLEAEVQRALAAGTDAGLRVLGYGEITLVLGWPSADGINAIFDQYDWTS